MQDVRAKYFAKMDEADPAKFDPLKALSRQSTKRLLTRKKRQVQTKVLFLILNPHMSVWAKRSLLLLTKLRQQMAGSLSRQTFQPQPLSPNVLSAWQQQNPDKAFDSLSGLQKEKLLVRSIQSFKKFDAASGQYVNYTEQEATQRAKGNA